MSEVYYASERVTLHLGDTLDVARTLQDGAADCIVTSPPYYGLRDYGTDGQHGAEETLPEYVDGLVAVLHEYRRVLADDGTLWLNLGDGYGPRKQLRGVPWRVAIALQDDGWILRNDIVWQKPNAKPESVRDRLSNRHEHIFLFVKQPRYAFNLDAIRVPHAAKSIYQQEVARRRPHAPGKAAQAPGQAKQSGMASGLRELNPLGKNPGDVWDISTRRFNGAHFAAFPLDLPERCIKAGCKPGGTVLDPYSGSATTGLAALGLGRKYIGVDNKAEYHDLALSTRLADYTRGE